MAMVGYVLGDTCRDPEKSRFRTSIRQNTGTDGLSTVFTGSLTSA